LYSSGIRDRDSAGAGETTTRAFCLRVYCLKNLSVSVSAAVFGIYYFSPIITNHQKVKLCIVSNIGGGGYDYSSRVAGSRPRARWALLNGNSAPSLDLFTCVGGGYEGNLVSTLHTQDECVCVCIFNKTTRTLPLGVGLWVLLKRQVRTWWQRTRNLRATF
jgi:hypothetical protein